MALAHSPRERLTEAHANYTRLMPKPAQLSRIVASILVLSSSRRRTTLRFHINGAFSHATAGELEKCGLAMRL